MDSFRGRAGSAAEPRADGAALPATPPMIRARPSCSSPFLQEKDQFPPKVRSEYESLGYRYIVITELTKRSDVVKADKHNQAMYKSSVANYREQNRYGTATADVEVVPPPHPTNLKRFELRQASRKKKDSLAQTVAVYNLTLYDKHPFIDYQPHEAVEVWKQMVQHVSLKPGRSQSSPFRGMSDASSAGDGRRLTSTGDGRRLSSAGSIASPPPNVHPLSRQASYGHFGLSEGGVFLDPDVAGWQAYAHEHQAAMGLPSSLPTDLQGQAGGRGPLGRPRTESCPSTPPPPSYAASYAAPPAAGSSHRPSSQLYMSGRAPAGRK